MKDRQFSVKQKIYLVLIQLSSKQDLYNRTDQIWLHAEKQVESNVTSNL